MNVKKTKDKSNVWENPTNRRHKSKQYYNGGSGGVCVQKVWTFCLKYAKLQKEINKRITSGWAAFAKHRDLLKSNIPFFLKRKLLNSYILTAGNTDVKPGLLQKSKKIN